MRFLGRWWREPWIWVSIALFLALTLAMTPLALWVRPGRR